MPKVPNVTPTVNTVRKFRYPPEVLHFHLIFHLVSKCDGLALWRPDFVSTVVTRTLCVIRCGCINHCRT